MKTATFPLVLTSPHEQGPLVKDAQQCLTDNPHGRFYDGMIDGEYGPLTAQAAYRAKFWCGYTLANLNQVYGPDIHTLLQDGAKLTKAQKARRSKRKKESQSKPLAEKALAEAARWIGTKESPAGSNSAKPFTTWYGNLEWGHEVRFAWCAVFVTYCYAKVGSTAANPKVAQWRYCPWMVDDARAGRDGLALLSARSVQPGNIVLFDWDGGVADHVGLFDKWLVRGQTFQTIEGNTAVGNDSNGGQVMRRQRSVSQVECFAKVTR